MALPFTPEQAPLVRSVLIHKPQSAVLIMIAHHAIADGMAFVFLIRDLLQVLSGGQIEALSFSSAAEELLSKLPKGEKIVQAEASQAGAHQAEPALYQEGNGLAPRATGAKVRRQSYCDLQGAGATRRDYSPRGTLRRLSSCRSKDFKYMA
jgi:hypothetical protein